MALLTKLFSGFKWHQTIEYLLIVLLTIATPIDWHLGVWVLMALTLFTLVKGIVTRRVGNPALGRLPRICLYLLILLYVIYMVSTLYSSNPTEAWSTTIITMMPLALLPAIFLTSDMTFLQQKHRSALIHLLAITLTVRFVVMAIRATISYLHGTPANMLIDFHFDPLHHNYLAMYLIAAVVLLYTELQKNWISPTWHKIRWLTIADMLLLILYMVIMGSRSGLVVLALVAVVCMIHLAFVKKQWLATGLMIIALGITIGASYLAAPKLYWRILYSIERLASGQQGDSRQMLWLCGLEVLQGHEIIGLGCDGYWDLLKERYIAHDFAEGYTHEQYNTHNQYLETALATGIVGLSVMLAFILMPIFIACRRKSRNLSMILFTLVYAGCIAFEASFARQMGLLFIFWWYAILLLDLRKSPVKLQCEPNVNPLAKPTTE